MLAAPRVIDGQSFVVFHGFAHCRSKYVVKLCVTHFQKITPRDYKHALQLLQLSEPILPLMTEKACVHMCQELVKLPSLNHAILSSSTFMALERLFSSDHVPMAPEKLCALVEVRPPVSCVPSLWCLPQEGGRGEIEHSFAMVAPSPGHPQIGASPVR